MGGQEKLKAEMVLNGLLTMDFGLDPARDGETLECYFHK